MKKLIGIVALACGLAVECVAQQPPLPPGPPPLPPVAPVKKAKKVKHTKVAGRKLPVVQVMELRPPGIGNRIICYRYHWGVMEPNWRSTAKDGDGKVIIYFLDDKP